MTQAQLNRAVASATGETISEIRRMGFGLADPAEVAFDPAPEEGTYVDWDAVDGQRCALMPC
jgi:hypothetical protein